MSNIVLVYTTFSNLEEAKTISEKLLSEKLVFCVNIFSQVNSLYLWKDEIHNSYEVVTIMKSRSGKVDMVIKKIEAMHSYDQPAIMILPVEKTNRAFTDWVSNAIN
ncbi:divalent cation tolerance protein CutA [Wolbachia endosymbiont of Dipetalonema caudispina]|uniref:divalent-cation tolerance protein CutA n=1 Tax=Wolbachia endosymbiont of Dipetalonema caudispina TaxID=1812112 RepID=UPI00158C05C9|nr:divalent-cation tolerance protein CutA [Wolbachia endosymbiont of Dipetalonema caudispina]QKX01143.1 divalent cation tolerance protein CutA [Wolbachia endosymbiont of Dipetalonema caudispina]